MTRVNFTTITLSVDLNTRILSSPEYVEKLFRNASISLDQLKADLGEKLKDEIVKSLEGTSAIVTISEYEAYPAETPPCLKALVVIEFGGPGTGRVDFLTVAAKLTEFTKNWDAAR